MTNNNFNIIRNVLFAGPYISAESRETEKIGQKDKLEIFNPKRLESLIRKIESAYITAIHEICLLQSRIDTIGCEIEKKFSELNTYMGWDRLNAILNKELDGDWKAKLAKSLAFIPARSAVKVIQLLYQYIKTILIAIVHPSVSLQKLLDQLKLLIQSLNQPEFWTALGTGMIGSGLGSTAVGNPLSMIGMILGTVSLAGGLSAGAIREALKCKNERASAALNYVKNQLSNIPQAFSDALLLGLIIGGVQRALREESRLKYAHDYIKDKNLPKNYSEIFVHRNGHTWIIYEGNTLNAVRDHPLISEFLHQVNADPSLGLMNTGLKGFTPYRIEVGIGLPTSRVYVLGNFSSNPTMTDIAGIRSEKLFGTFVQPKPLNVTMITYPVILAGNLSKSEPATN